MATTIRIKNSAVAGKLPAEDSIEVAELALNLADRKLYSKDSDDNVFEIGSSVDSGDTLPDAGTNVGELFWDTDTETLYYWDGTTWQSIATGSSVEGEYVKLTGSNMTGDLTLGTDKIVLDAGTGGASFASTVQVAGNPNSGGVAGSTVDSSGGFKAARTSGSQANFRGYLVGTASPTSQITASGAASFAGQVLVGDEPFGGAGVGSKLTIGACVATASAGNNDVWIGYVNGTGTATSRITGGGSADFKGDVVIGDSATLFNLVSDVVAALPAKIKEEYAGVINTWNLATPYTDPTTLPADIPTPLKDAVVRATTAGKINLNANDGSATFVSGDVVITDTGIIRAWSSGAVNPRIEFNGGGLGAFDGSDGSTIQLSSSDGSASFAGNLDVGDYNGGTDGTFVGEAGQIQVRRTTGPTNQVWAARDSNGVTSEILQNGSSSFSGPQTLASPSSPATNGYTSHINNTVASTAACFTGNNHNADGIIFLGVDGGNGNALTTTIKNNGAASFAGPLNVQDFTLESAFSYSILKTDATGFWSPDNWFFGPDVSNPSSAVISLNATDGTITATGYSMANLAQL